MRAGWVRSQLPKRFRASVKAAEELRMGSPQYGRLFLDGEELADVGRIESRSLLWSDDGRRLAAQELVWSRDDPQTRVVVFDTGSRTRIAASPPRRGFGIPVRFEADALVYRHAHAAGERELRLTIDERPYPAKQKEHEA
jgi:hypothetical protein